MGRDIFKEIDHNVVNVVAPSISKGRDLSKRVRYITEELGKTRGILWRKTTECKSGDLLLVSYRRGFTRHIKVFYKDELVLHVTDFSDRVHRFLDGPWVNELVPLYWKAKLAYLEFAHGVDYIDELCDHFNHDTGHCAIHTDRTCPCIDFKHEEV